VGTAIALIVALQVTRTIEVASIGIPDTLLLMLLALVVFGPRRLPEIGRQIGKLMYEFRKVSNDFKFQMEEELRANEEAERQKKLQAEQEAARLRAAEAPPMLEADTAAAANVGAESASESVEAAPAVAGEVRGEPRKFPPNPIRVQPPSSGETVEAARPFRGHADEPAGAQDTVTPHESQTVAATEANVDSNVDASCGGETITITEEGQEIHHG